jgi:hypothetical protein
MASTAKRPVVHDPPPGTSRRTGVQLVEKTDIMIHVHGVIRCKKGQCMVD